jgi:hypothetical protein
LPVRVIECAELLAADLFKNADQTRPRITLGDVEPSWPVIHRTACVAAVCWWLG